MADFLVLMVGSTDTDDDAPEEVEEVEALYEVDNRTIEQAEEIIVNYPEVMKARERVEDEKIVLNILVLLGVAEEKAVERLDDFARLLGSFQPDMEGPTKDTMGELYGFYDVEAAAFSAEEERVPVVVRRAGHTRPIHY